MTVRTKNVLLTKTVEPNETMNKDKDRTSTKVPLSLVCNIVDVGLTNILQVMILDGS